MFEADIRDCFGTINHEALMAQVARRVVARSMLKLIRCWLRMGVLEGGGTSPTGAGTPQGSPISPLLANIALHVLDEAWQNEGRRLGTQVRYCDDFVVLSPNEQRPNRPVPARGSAGSALAARCAADRRHDRNAAVVPRRRNGAGAQVQIHGASWFGDASRVSPPLKEVLDTHAGQMASLVRT